MPPMGVSCPAPRTIRSWPPLDTKMPPGTARPSTAAPNATAPLRLSAGGPNAAKAPPAGAGSPWATTFWSWPRVHSSTASSVSRPRRTVARKTTSPRALIAGVSRLDSTPDGMPGAAAPLSATGRTTPLRATKMPSTDRPPAIAAANTTAPSSLNAGVGCLPKPDSRPTPATRSPSRATATTRPPDHRNRPSSVPPRPRVEKNTTSPRPFTGATTGIDSVPKRSKTPPPGAGSPLTATRRSPEGASAATAAATVSVSSARARPSRPMRRWRAGHAREYRETGETSQ